MAVSGSSWGSMPHRVDEDLERILERFIHDLQDFTKKRRLQKPTRRWIGWDGSKCNLGDRGGTGDAQRKLPRDLSQR